MAKSVETQVKCYASDEAVNVSIVKGKSIRIEGVNKNSVDNTPFDKSFEIGSEVVCGSYNLIYLGKIVSITAKNVIIDEGNGADWPNKRMRLAEFIERNWNFDIVRIRERNAITSQSI